jgi:uncharacterized protein
MNRVFVCLLALAATALAGRPLASQSSATRGTAATRFMDEAGLLAPDVQARFESYLRSVRAESGVDVRFLVVRGVPGGDLESFALQRLRASGVGRRVDRRGLLFVVDMASQRMRVEVGPTLEGVFTDGFVGYLIREHAAAFFAARNPELGLRTMMFMVHRRLREAALGKDYDPRAVRFVRDRVRLAAGGGATARTALGDSSHPFLGRPATDRERLQFSPRPTPQDAYDAYLQWLRDGQFQTDLPLFTPATQQRLRVLPLTRAYNDYILLGEYGQAYTRTVRGDLALLAFTTTPLVSPHFFRHTPAGWQIDLDAEVRNTVEYTGGAYSWGIRPSGDDYSRTFADRFMAYGRVVRVADGDNRPLPTAPRRRRR